MNDNKFNKILWWLGCLLGILILLLGVLAQWLTDYDYNKLLLIIPYRWQLILWLLVVVIILLLFTYHKTFPNFNSRNPEQNSSLQIRNQLKYLTQNEKEYLKKYLDADESILKFSRTDEIAHSLQIKGIFENVSHPESLHPTYSYKISDVYWNYLKKNSKVLKI